MLILHGTADTTTPLSGSQRFAEKLKEVGVDHELVTVEGAVHSFDLQPNTTVALNSGGFAPRLL
jgi:dipeptidyl aminopeptidase/acylaminoacyl peptidase